MSINDNEDKKIFVVPLSHTLKEDIEREVMIRTMIRIQKLIDNAADEDKDVVDDEEEDGVIPSHVILFRTVLFCTAARTTGINVIDQGMKMI